MITKSDLFEILTLIQMEIIKLLEKEKRLSRQEIIKQLKYPKTTIHDNLKYLIKHDFIKRYKVYTNKIGTPPIVYYIEK